MSAKKHLPVAILALAALPVAAQNFDGTFTAANDQGGQTVVKLAQSGEKVTGTMTGPDNTFQIGGVVEEDIVFGTMDLGEQGEVYFEAELDANDLYLTLAALDEGGEPAYETATMFLLTRVGSGAQAQEGATAVRDNDAAGDPEPEPLVSQNQTAPGRIHDGSSQAIEWADFLANKKATKMSSYSSGGAGGYSSRTDFHLCSNGQFHMAGSSSVSVDVGDASGYSGGSGSDAGTWRVFSQGQLVGVELRYQNGEVSQARLDYDQQTGATYVDGERWYITPTNECY